LQEEEKAASEWERKTAYAVVSHEFGLVFEALSECLRSKNAELFTTSLVCATWLVYMLSLLPDTGVLGAARVCMLRQFVVVLRSAKHGSDRVLAMVALRSFMNDRGWLMYSSVLALPVSVWLCVILQRRFSEGMHDITTYIKDVLKTLRELKKSSGLAFEMLKLLSDGQESSVVMLPGFVVVNCIFKKKTKNCRTSFRFTETSTAGHVESQGDQPGRLQLEW
jgi:hypothetical protein